MMLLRRRRADDGFLALVGWVFADTLLALTVIFLATQQTIPIEPPPPPQAPRPIGVDGSFVCFRVLTNPQVLAGPPGPARDALLADLDRQIQSATARPELNGRKAGIVLSFGVAPTPGPGSAAARDFNAVALSRNPGVFSRVDGATVPSRAFWDGGPGPGRPLGSIAVNIYPVIDDAHPALGRDLDLGC